MPNRPKILIVDDKVENLVAMERVLSTVDADIIRALSGNEAIKKTLENDFALCLIDVQMPEMDGFETVEILHSESKTEHMPVIFISAVFSDDYYQIKGIETGALDFIVKPFNPAILIGKLRMHLDLHNQRIKLQEAKDLLESQVQERTAELVSKNQELKDTTSQLIQNEKLSALGEMTAGVAHELNQPLNGMKIICQGILLDIKKERFDQTTLVDDLKEVVGEVNRMAGIINHMRTFSRRIIEDEGSTANINESVEGVFKLMGQQLQVHNIQVKRELDPALPQVMIDQMKLEQVLMNLITNARHALEESGEKSMVLEMKSFLKEGDGPREVVLSIKDNAHGVPQDIQAKIFEPFYTTKRPGKGTGLGLSISSKIITDANGRLELVVEEGVGSTFNIILPVAEMTSVEETT